MSQRMLACYYLLPTIGRLSLCRVVWRIYVTRLFGVIFRLFQSCPYDYQTNGARIRATGIVGILKLSGMFTTKLHAVNPCKKPKPESLKNDFLYQVLKMWYICEPWHLQYVLVSTTNFPHMLLICNDILCFFFYDWISTITHNNFPNKFSHCITDKF